MTTPTDGTAKTSQERLRAIFIRELDTMQGQLALTWESETGRGIASAILDAWRWLDTPGMTWEELARRVANAYSAAVIEHRRSGGTGHEDIWAYARTDGFSGVRLWMSDITREQVPGR